MSTEVEPRCPRCGGLFTPDEVKRALPTAECTFCKMTVLLRREEPAPVVEAPPLAWPKGFEVVETPAPKPAPASALVRVGGDPYREPGTQALALRPGLTITWKDDNFDTQVFIGVFGLLWATGTALAWILTILGTYAVGKLALAIATLVTVALAWATKMAWNTDNWLLADHEGLHWTRYTLTTRVVKEQLPASDIAQLYVRDETERDDDGFVFRRFVLYARDHAGRDHRITTVEDPEQAWWLEARIEQHLGIVNRRIEGEHRREPPLLPAPADS